MVSTQFKNHIKLIFVIFFQSDICIFAPLIEQSNRI